MCAIIEPKSKLKSENYDTLLNLTKIKYNPLMKFQDIVYFMISNKVFIGDGGAYMLGFVFSVWVILLQYKIVNISPFFIILLLWYPCFENLFSIIRKVKLGHSPINPDTNHLHHLIFFYFQKNKKFSKKKSNNISSCLINLFNFLIIYIGSINPYNTSLQLIIIFISILVYVILYLKLFKIMKLIR